MTPIPKIDGADMAFGNIKHLPKYDEIPQEFKGYGGNAYVRAVSHWFFRGGEKSDNGVTIDGKRFVARAGVDANKALGAIKAILASWEPKHEHKTAGAAFLLSEWFEVLP